MQNVDIWIDLDHVPVDFFFARVFWTQSYNPRTKNRDWIDGCVCVDGWVCLFLVLFWWNKVFVLEPKLTMEDELRKKQKIAQEEEIKLQAKIKVLVQFFIFMFLILNLN